MARWDSFADLLEEALARELAAVVSAEPTSPLSSGGAFVAAPWIGAVTARPSAAALRPYVSSEAEARRHREAHARVALESLDGTPVDYTPDDLRAAFHQLAYQYHPDRHPQATADQTRQLTGAFATVCANYRRLLTTPMN